ncbi:MAG: radical SAM protein [Patescibacteria group bacterium]
MSFGNLKIFSYQSRRFLYFFFKHITLKKFINLILINFERLIKKLKPKGKPFYITLEPTNICPLRCPLCPTGSGKTQRPKGYMNFELYKKIVDELEDCLFFIILHAFGEPFLNKDIFRMIAYARQKNIGTVISTNLCTVNEKEISRIVSSGLEHLIVSLDAADQETYLKYRLGGDFNKVIKNLSLLVREKRKQKSSIPFIEWQYIIMKHNQSEIKKAKEIAEKIGVNKFKNYTEAKIDLTFFKGYYDRVEANKWLTPQKIKELEKMNYQKTFLFGRPCSFLWHSAVIYWDGRYYPCCYVEDEKNAFADYNKESFAKIWHSLNYQASRNIFKKNKKEFNFKTVCHLCKQHIKP